jgi:2-keto-3-deoxy-L-rhamnonate aldolase RhmA
MQASDLFAAHPKYLDVISTQLVALSAHQPQCRCGSGALQRHRLIERVLASDAGTTNLMIPNIRNAAELEAREAPGVLY